MIVICVDIFVQFSVFTQLQFQDKENKKRNYRMFNSFSQIMPATGIEPVLYRYNRILSPARLPVPPRRHICNSWVCDKQNRMGRGGFEPPKQFAADLQSVPFGHSGIYPFLLRYLLTRQNYSIRVLFMQVFFSKIIKFLLLNK